MVVPPRILTLANGQGVEISDANTVLFTIRADGTIERGPGFTTIDEMSLKFWEAVERHRPKLR